MKNKREQIVLLQIEKNYIKQIYKNDPHTLTYINILELISRIRYLQGQLKN